MDFHNTNVLANENTESDILIDEVASDGYTMTYPHHHPHYELLIITNGNYTIYCNGRYISSNRPEIFLHCPYTLHSLNAERGTEYSRTIIRFDKSLLDHVDYDILNRRKYTNVSLFRIIPSPEQFNEIFTIIDNIKTALSDSITAHLYLLLLLRKLIFFAEYDSGEILSNSASYIQAAIQYAAENLYDPPTVEALSRRFGISQSKFFSDFKENTGMTYKKYLTELRQNQALKLLKNGAKIIDASLEVGYSSEAHFIKAFREFWGVTPGEFTKQSSKKIVE